MVNSFFFLVIFFVVLLLVKVYSIGNVVCSVLLSRVDIGRFKVLFWVLSSVVLMVDFVKVLFLMVLFMWVVSVFRLLVGCFFNSGVR